MLDKACQMLKEGLCNMIHYRFVIGSMHQSVYSFRFPAIDNLLYACVT